MNSRIFFGRSGFERNRFQKLILTALVLAGLAGTPAMAQHILAGAQLSGVALGGNHFAYTLTLENTAASTSDIQMFWFAWAAGGADFLASEPTSILAPAGWNYVLEGGGPDDGYSIQFVTFTTPLTPGSSLTFTFDSTDSPKTMAGPASLFPSSPTLSSVVYSAHAADGVQEQVIAQVVPPPGTGLGPLTAQRSHANLIFTWISGTNVVLQQSSDLSSTNWTTVAGTLGAETYTATNVASKAATFYRLATQ